MQKFKSLSPAELTDINGGDTPYCNGNSAGQAVRQFFQDIYDEVSGWF